MTKKSGLTDGQFEQLVDEGFKEPLKKRQRHLPNPPVEMPTEVIVRLEEEGADPRLSKSEARFNAAICRCLGVKPSTLSDESVTFIKAIDAAGCALAKAHDIPLRD